LHQQCCLKKMEQVGASGTKITPINQSEKNVRYFNKGSDASIVSSKVAVNALEDYQASLKPNR
jgi:hypothetical protein